VGQEGAAEVDMRRKIFQSDDPMVLIRAVQAIARGSLSRRRPMIGSCPGSSERL
jgi:DhnA family fructose-bisphosphate aldolase class Ia